PAPQSARTSSASLDCFSDKRGHGRSLLAASRDPAVAGMTGNSACIAMYAISYPDNRLSTSTNKVARPRRQQRQCGPERWQLATGTSDHETPASVKSHAPWPSSSGKRTTRTLSSLRVAPPPAASLASSEASERTASP